MTVIATDGRSIAADSLVIFGSERGMRPASKLRVDGERIMGFAGPTAMQDPVFDWARDGGSAETVPKGDDPWALLIVGVGEVWLIQSSAPYALRVDPPFAIGSAADFALAAMHVGLPPHDAVAVACKLSTQCGPPIVEYDIGKETRLARAVKVGAGPLRS